MTSPILNCDLHDYLEIACLYEIEVELLLVNGSSYVGTAITTRSYDAEEFLSFRSTEDGNSIDIPTLSIASMRAIKSNTHFDRVIFSEEGDGAAISN